MNIKSSDEQETWGAQVNLKQYHSRPHSRSKSGRLPLKEQKLREQGLVVWDAEKELIVHLYPEAALDLLDTLREDKTWQQLGTIIGEWDISSRLASTDATKDEQAVKQHIEDKQERGRYHPFMKTIPTFKDTMPVTPEQTQFVFSLLERYEEQLERIAKARHEEMRKSVKGVYEVLFRETSLDKAAQVDLARRLFPWGFSSRRCTRRT